MRVATWNVLWRDRQDRLGLIVRHLSAIGADVVLLQESSPSHAAEVATALGLHVAGVPGDTDTDHSSVPALLTRAPAEARLVPLPDRSPGQRAWLIYVDLADEGATYRVATTHLAATPSAWRMCVDADYANAHNPHDIEDKSIAKTVGLRLTQLGSVLQHLGDPSSTRIIVGGDMNFPEAGLEHRTVLTAGLVDAARRQPRLGALTTILANNPLVSDHPEPGVVCGSGGSTSLPDYALDHFFTAPSVQTTDVWTFGTAGPDRQWPSDHLGLAGDFR